MAYTKQTWADLPSKTTPINAERLTHIEDGIFDAAQTADTAASTAGTAAANIGIVSGRVETLTDRVNGLDTAVSNKVDKVAGKGLSTNDYDNTDKGKVDSLGTAAAKNAISVVTDSSDLVESGAVCRAIGIDFKNLFNPTLDSKLGSVTVVKNADNTYTVNGTAQVNTSYDIGTFTFKANTTYMLSGCPTGLSSEVYLRASNNDFTIQKQDKGSGIVISFDTDTTLNINIRVGTGQTLNDVVFSPMIELGSVKTTYEPYHASVEESKCDNSVIGTVEDGANPTKAYAVGEHMVRGRKFCTVTVAVTTSSTWTLGSNYVEGTIADNLVKQATFSGTTTASGQLIVSDDSTKIIVGIRLNNPNVITHFYTRSAGGTTALFTDNSLQIKANESVSGTYYYI